MAYQTYIFTWRGIDIEARYDPYYCKDVVAHLEFEAINPIRARLPMTQTGYRSHFHTIGTIERDFDGDIIACLTAWLDAEAQSKEWQAYMEQSRQGDLFG